MSRVVNIRRCFELFDDTFSAKVIGELNGQMIMAVRCEGDRVPWHSHDYEDEMFLVIDGTLEIHERDQRALLGPGIELVSTISETHLTPSGIQQPCAFFVLRRGEEK